MTVRAVLVSLALVAACSDEKPKAKTATLAEAKIPLARSDAAPPAPPMLDRVRDVDPEAMEAHAAGGGGGEPGMGVGAEEESLPPGKVWLTVPGLGVDVAVAPEVKAGKPRAGGAVVLTDGTSELHLRRAAPGQDREAVKEQLAAEGGGKLAAIVDKVDGPEFHLEYAMKDRKSGKPVFGLVMRRSIGGQTVDCTSRGPETRSTAMALVACHSMRATPR